MDIMQIQGYVKLGIAALLPVVVAILVYLLENKTKFGTLSRVARQIIIGIIFGILAIVGTEWGIPLNGAQVNCRDAAVLIAGFLFGGHAGILAGLIGGIERWFAVYWGVGTFTRVACSVSTIFAGFAAGFLKKRMFEDKRTGWLLSFEIGVCIEVFHLTMVFVTNLDQTEKALSVVKSCSLPMILANGLSLMLATIIISAMAGDNKDRDRTKVKVSESVQTLLLLAILIALIATTAFVYELQTEISISQTTQTLSTSVEDLISDINDASADEILADARAVKQEYEAGGISIEDLAKKYDLEEICVVNEQGIIIDSNIKDYFGFDMNSGEQSAEFMCLLRGQSEYVQEYGSISFDQTVKRKYAGVSSRDGFIQVAYNEDQFNANLRMDIAKSVRNKHIGKNGFIVVLDENYKVVSAPENLLLTDLSKVFKNAIEGETLLGENVISEITVAGTKDVMLYKTSEDFKIIALLPKDEAYETRNDAMYITSFMEILAFGLLFVVIYFIVDKVVVKNIQKVNRSLNKISAGDLDEVVNVRTAAEFTELSNDINATVDTLKEYITEAENRMKGDLEMATSIQLSALPNKFPAFPKRKDFDIYASMTAAKEVGGDFYDLYMTHSKYLNFVVADVSGKGIPGALFMMRAKTELQTLTKADLLIDQVFTEGNDALCEGNDAGLFVTAWQGGINLNTGLVEYANAGHNPPLVKHAGGKFEYLRSKVNLVLAGMPGVKYKMQELQLGPGDIIFLYTDGITEATNIHHELYGEDRLINLLNSRDFIDMKDLCDTVIDDVTKFTGEAPQFDDETTLALQYFGSHGEKWFSLDADIEGIPRITNFVDSWLEKMGCPLKAQMQIDVAIDEIFANIASYAYKGFDKKGRMGVILRENDEPHGVTLKFVDTGRDYNPLEHEDPDTTLSAEERGIGGLGILMVKKSMDECKYERINGKNIFTITKNFPKMEE